MMLDTTDTTRLNLEGNSDLSREITAKSVSYINSHPERFDADLAARMTEPSLLEMMRVHTEKALDAHKLWDESDTVYELEAIVTTPADDKIRLVVDGDDYGWVVEPQ